MRWVWALTGIAMLAGCDDGNRYSGDSPQRPQVLADNGPDVQITVHPDVGHPVDVNLSSRGNGKVGSSAGSDVPPSPKKRHHHHRQTPSNGFTATIPRPRPTAPPWSKELQRALQQGDNRSWRHQEQPISPPEGGDGG